MLRNVKIEDTLQERVESAIDDVKALLAWYVKKNNSDSLPCLNNDLDYDGSVHQIIDYSVPVYTKEIEDTWYLHSSDLEEAYQNAGCGNNPRENDGMAAIYFYISEKVNDWYSNEAQNYFEELKGENNEKNKNQKEK